MLGAALVVKGWPWRGWALGLLLSTSCATGPPEPPPGSVNPASEPLAGGLAALASGRFEHAATLLDEAGRRYPALADYALYFSARTAARAGRRDAALESVSALLERYPDSVWGGPARLLVGQLLRQSGDLEGGRSWLTAARESLPPGDDRWARATLALAELEGERNDPAHALELAREVRRARPRGLVARRARRLGDRLRAARPEVAPSDRVDEAEIRLREGDAPGAEEESTSALAEPLEPDLRARALWVEAQAKRARGDRAAAEAVCLALARELPSDPLAARALVAAAGWRWNADDDVGALGLFEQAVDRFPESAQAPEVLYAIGRIHQEHGAGDVRRYGDAAAAYTRLGERFPASPLAPEARWRAGWVRYLAGDFVLAERSFRQLAADSKGNVRAAAEYWRARALERLGHTVDAEARFANLAEAHPDSYYASLAETRLGKPSLYSQPPPAQPQVPFPASLAGAHGERARLLAGLGFPRFARVELDAVAASGIRGPELLDAYHAIGAPGAAIRLARAMQPESPEGLQSYLYPLGYWDTVRTAASAENVDPLLVVALIRQESLFEPEAVSVANAHGLMQLLPATAAQLSGGPPPTRDALHDPTTNVRLGVTFLRRLLDRYDGSLMKTLAAYNAGQDAVAKWERRYAGRDEAEFVELISFRETRDYVKTVLGNYRLYQRLYAPSPSATSAGSPPNAPFDMTTMTSPGRAESIR